HTRAKSLDVIIEPNIETEPEDLSAIIMTLVKTMRNQA
uniref:Uncharacterized protein n=1 Tax=Amphimedon queenslandica TaxID=400682 RepID=A0A1X7TJE1_AMPQE